MLTRRVDSRRASVRFVAQALLAPRGRLMEGAAGVSGPLAAVGRTTSVTQPSGVWRHHVHDEVRKISLPEQPFRATVGFARHIVLPEQLATKLDDCRSLSVSPVIPVIPVSG